MLDALRMSRCRWTTWALSARAAVGVAAQRQRVHRTARWRGCGLTWGAPSASRASAVIEHRLERLRSSTSIQAAAAWRAVASFDGHDCRQHIADAAHLLADRHKAGPIVDRPGRTSARRERPRRWRPLRPPPGHSALLVSMESTRARGVGRQRDRTVQHSGAARISST